MKLAGKLNHIAIDTNIFIYFFSAHSQFYFQTSSLFEVISNKNIKVSTSNVTLIELLSFKASPSQIKKLENEFLQIPNLQIIEVSNDIAVLAAKIRRKYGFRLADAIQLATCVVAKASIFITNDNKLTSFKETSVIPLQEFSAQ